MLLGFFFYWVFLCLYWIDLRRGTMPDRTEIDTTAQPIKGERSMAMTVADWPSRPQRQLNSAARARPRFDCGPPPLPTRQRSGDDRRPIERSALRSFHSVWPSRFITAPPCNEWLSLSLSHSINDLFLLLPTSPFFHHDSIKLGKTQSNLVKPSKNQSNLVIITQSDTVINPGLLQTQ